VVQTRLKSPPASPEKGSLGVPASSTQPALQQDVFKELVNKLAWALGSTYRQPYGNRRSPVRTEAQKLATQLILAHGYPWSIAQ